MTTRSRSIKDKSNNGGRFYQHTQMLGAGPHADIERARSKAGVPSGMEFETFLLRLGLGCVRSETFVRMLQAYEKVVGDDPAAVDSFVERIASDSLAVAQSPAWRSAKTEQS